MILKVTARLLDISKIYKEIQEEDKKYGTNRAQALVEQLAGKNRSNIASSILLNGDILEKVYNASKNESAGSAQKELDTYLDSVEGKMAKLQNRIQELTSTAVDSGFLKGLIEGLTHILELANSIVDTFGTLPTLLGAISGVVLQKRGLGKRKFPSVVAG